MDYTEVLGIKKGAAVCYSGYRNGQRPGHIYPSYDEVKEDLRIIEKQWQYIDFSSCSIAISLSKQWKIFFISQAFQLEFH